MDADISIAIATVLAVAAIKAFLEQCMQAAGVECYYSLRTIDRLMNLTPTERW